MSTGRTIMIALGFTLAMIASCRSAGSDLEMPASPEGAELYKQNCAACHGEQGTGDGAASIALAVRPRDFRNEPFRYVSTMVGVPQRDDLLRTILRGRRYGEMPAHPQFTERQAGLLADYVLALHRLGWQTRLQNEAAEGEEMTAEEILEIAQEKITPEDPIEVTDPPPGFRPSLDQGRRIYVANCASCHGTTGRGDGLDLPKDDQGRPIKVRNLTVGAFRGGIGPREIFKRLRCGVPGTPMASQALLSDEHIWQLVYYSLHLSGRQVYGS